MRRWSILAGATLTACAMPADPAVESAALAITDGSVDDHDPAVIALATDGAVSCTGTLVAPDAILTAAHCVVPEPPEAAWPGTSPGDAGPAVPVVSAVAHPEFDPERLRHDIAVVRLAYDLQVRPVPMLGPAVREDLVGAAIRIVGFGQSSADDPTPPLRRSGTTRIADADETTLRFGPEPSQTCLGDSGGPSLLRGPDGVERIAGVHSAGDRECAWSAMDTRVDAHADFVARELSAPTGTGSVTEAGRLVGHCAMAGPGSRSHLEGGLLLALFGLARRRRA